MFCSYWQAGNSKGEENEVIEVQSRAKRFRVNCWGKIPSKHAHGMGIFLRLDKTSKIDKSENCLACCNITRGWVVHTWNDQNSYWGNFSDSFKPSLSTNKLSINGFIIKLLSKLLRDLSKRVHLKSISKFINKVINRYCFCEGTLKNMSIY